MVIPLKMIISVKMDEKNVIFNTTIIILMVVVIVLAVVTATAQVIFNFLN